MSTRRLPTRSPRRLRRLLAALPLVAAFACAEGADPVAPPAARTLSPAAAPAANAAATDNEFSNVQVQSEGMGLAVKFNYTGVVTPSFTILTVEAYPKQVISVAAKKQAGGYWTAHAGGLKAERLYKYRLDNLKSTYEGTAKTLRRDIKFDLDSVYAFNDGDPGPSCGEILIRPYLGHYGTGFQGDTGSFRNFFLFERSMCSGYMYHFADWEGGMSNTIKGFSNTKLTLYIQVYELDKDYYCGNWTPDCGQQVNTKHNPNNITEYAVHQSGSQPFVLSTWWGFTPHLKFYGKLIVNYVPW